MIKITVDIFNDTFYLYSAPHFIAFATHIIWFILRSKECSRSRAENAGNQKICHSFTMLPLTSCETLNEPLKFMKYWFPDLENGSMGLGCISGWRFFINSH